MFGHGLSDTTALFTQHPHPQLSPSHTAQGLHEHKHTHVPLGGEGRKGGGWGERRRAAVPTFISTLTCRWAPLTVSRVLSGPEGLSCQER